MNPRLLSEVSSATLESMGDESPGPHCVVWGLGSLEHHGTHLPLASDTIVVEAVCAELRKELNASAPEAGVWWQLPTLGLGASGAHEGFPGTVSVGTEALVQVLLEVGRSVAKWAKRLVIVTAHGDNAEALSRAVPILRGEAIDACWLNCVMVAERTEPQAHAGSLETALLLHLRPELVVSPAPESQETDRHNGARSFEAMVADAITRVTRNDLDTDGQLLPAAVA